MGQLDKERMSMWNSLSKKGKEAKLKASTNIMKRPFRSIGTAAALGCVAGYMLNKRRHDTASGNGNGSTNKV